MLSDLPTLKTALRIASTDTTQDSYLSQVLQVADRVVKQFCKQNLETAVYTEYPRLLGDTDLPLSQRPVRPLGITRAGLLQGTLTQGSPTVAGLPSSGYQSTATMQAGWPVCLHGQSAAANKGIIPYFTTISSVGSGAVTMSANAAASGTVYLIVGLDVYLDYGGLKGQGYQPNQPQPGVSLSNSQLYAGLDFILDVDESTYQGSKSGLLQRYGAGGPSGGAWSPFLFGGADAWYGNRGGLTAALSPRWERQPGSLTVVYVAGWGVGATPPSTFTGPLNTLPSTTTLPWDLVESVNKLAAAIRAITVVGAPVVSDGVSREALRMLSAAPEGSELGTVRKSLSFYRDYII